MTFSHNFLTHIHMSHILFQTEMVTANKQISPKTFCKTARFAVAAGHGEWSKTEFRYILFFPSHPSFMKNSRMNFQIHFLRPLPFYPVFLSVVHLPFPWPWSVPSPLFPRRTFFIHRRPIGEAEYWHPREGMNPPNTEANLTFPFQFSFYTLEDAAQNLLKVVSSIPSLFLSVKYSQTTHPPSADGKKGLSRTTRLFPIFLSEYFFL